MARILYKYLDITGAKCMIGNKNLQFTNASQLNAPFDCHPKLLDYSNVPKRKLQGWIPEEWWKMKEENDALNLRNVHGYAACQKSMTLYSCGHIIVITTKASASVLIWIK